MSEVKESGVKPKLEGKKFRKRMPTNSTPMKKEYYSKVLGLEKHTFDIGNAKNSAKFQMSLEDIAMYVQKQWEKGGADS